MADIKWLKFPEEHDYSAAESYLSLHFSPDQARRVSHALMQKGIDQFKAKDVLRASGLNVLGTENEHVHKDFKKIDQGEELSPVLLVGMYPQLIIADGFHRCCAVYLYDEDTDIPAQIVYMR